MKKLFWLLILVILFYIPNVSATNVYWDANIGGSGKSLKSYLSSNDFDVSHASKIVFNDVVRTEVVYNFDKNLDISKNKDNSVVALYDDDNDILYIQFEGTLYFNAYSSYLFSDLTVLEYLEGLDYVSTYNVTNMDHMFDNCANLVNLDVSSFDTSKVNSMYAMFDDCVNLETVVFGDWDTSKVTTMSHMFFNCNKLINVDLSGFDTQNVTNMSGMFRECTSLENLNLSAFDTSKVLDMSDMFWRCKNLFSLNLNGWNTSQVTTMEEMFVDCISLQSLDLSSFNTSQVTDMGSMFWCCLSLENLDISNFDTISVIDFSHMFYSCKKLVDLDVSNFNTASSTDMSYMFYGCESLVSLDLSNWNVKIVTNMKYMFYRCINLSNLNISGWNSKNVTDMSYMFCDCSELTELNLINLNTSKVTDMSYMFCGCSELTELDLSSFNTSNVKNMNYMFSRCLKLESIYVGDFWDTSLLSNPKDLFKNCNKLTGGLGSFNNSIEYARIDTPENPGNFSIKIDITSDDYILLLNSYIITPTADFNIDKLVISDNVSYIYDSDNRVLNCYYSNELVKRYKIFKWVSEKYDITQNDYYIRLGESFDINDIDTDFELYYPTLYINIKDSGKTIKTINITRFTTNQYSHYLGLSGDVLTLDKYINISDIYFHGLNENYSIVIKDNSGQIISSGVLGNDYSINVYKNDKLFDKYIIKIYIPIDNVEIDFSSKDENMDFTYDEYKVHATIYPLDTTEDKTIFWSTSNSDIAEIDDNGKITVRAPGFVIIYATLSNGNIYEFHTHFDRVINELYTSTEELTINLYETKNVVVNYDPIDITMDDSLRWLSDDTNVAKVDSNGNITAVGYGTTIIRAISLNNKECDIVVNVPKVDINSLVFAKIPIKVYTGKQIKPSLSVKYINYTLKNSIDYSLNYGTNKNTGKGWVKIALKGNYSGSKIFYFYIVPKQVVITKINSGSKYLKVTYKKTASTSGYQIAYKIKGTKSWKYTTSTSLSKTIKKLKSKKYYRVTVRAYKVVNGKKIYGAWATTKTIKVK